MYSKCSLSAVLPVIWVEGLGPIAYVLWALTLTYLCLFAFAMVSRKGSLLREIANRHFALAFFILAMVGPAQGLKAIIVIVTFVSVAAWEGGLLEFSNGKPAAVKGGGSRFFRSAPFLDPSLFALSPNQEAILTLYAALLKKYVVGALLSWHRFYQDLWFSKKHRRVRRLVKDLFSRPLKLRRYWFLTLGLSLRFEAAWLGLPFRQHPQFTMTNTFLGPLKRKCRATLLALLRFLKPGILGDGPRPLLTQACKFLNSPLPQSPSAIGLFVDTFQPEAPIYFRNGFCMVPPSRRRRLVNLVSDMEIFAGRGSSLLVFIFLIWSFFARILLVICFLGLF